VQVEKFLDFLSTTNRNGAIYFKMSGIFPKFCSVISDLGSSKDDKFTLYIEAFTKSLIEKKTP